MLNAKNLGVALAVFVATPSLCFAGDPATTTRSSSSSIPSASNIEDRKGDTASATPLVMSVDELADVSAGAAAPTNVVTNQNVSALNTGNAVNAANVTSGMISFAGSALSGYNGIGNFVMNTGNNNNLQGSLSVNIVGLPSQ